MAILFDDTLSERLERDDPRGPRGPASAQGVGHLGAVLDGVSPCYGAAKFGEPPACGATRRIVVGFGHPVAGMYTAECAKCGAVSSMRPADVDALAGATS